MMTNWDLFNELRRRGAWAWIEDNRLRIRAPKGTLDDLLASIDLHRGELWSALLELATVSAKCRVYSDRLEEYAEALIALERGDVAPDLARQIKEDHTQERYDEMSALLTDAEDRAEELEKLLGITVGPTSIARRWVLEINIERGEEEVDESGKVFEVFTV
ncbi:MAG: hypothetical protein M3O34_16235 [Chloroflexota bacterium]|nr:hypothetical protein [Chloroflexota bacterium]